MRKIVFTILLSLCLANTYCQRNVRDSLLQVLKTQKQDSTRVNTLLSLSHALYVSNPDTSIHLSIEALALSKQIDFPSGVSRSLGNIGIAYTTVGNFPKALDYYLQNLRLVEQRKDTTAICQLYNLLGVL